MAGGGAGEGAGGGAGEGAGGGAGEGAGGGGPAADTTKMLQQCETCKVWFDCFPTWMEQHRRTCRGLDQTRRRILRDRAAAERGKKQREQSRKDRKEAKGGAASQGKGKGGKKNP